MSAETLNDERKNYIAVQKIIDAMLEFDNDTRARILKTVSTFFGIQPIAQTETGEASSSARETGIPTFSNREVLSPKDFLVQKKPRTDVERVACLAYYLTHYRNTAQFKTMDISKLNTEAAQVKFSNASNAISNAVRAGFLILADRGARQLSAPGEKYVDHMPDRATAKRVMSELSPRRRRRAQSKETNRNSSRNGS